MTTLELAPETERILGPTYLRDAYKARAVERVSPTLLNTADICPRRAQFYNDRTLPRGFSESSVIGTAYHAGLETYYLVRQATGEVVPAEATVIACYDAVTASFDNFVDHQPADFTWETDHATAVGVAQGMIGKYFEGGCYWPANFRVEATEIPFYLPTDTPGWIRTGVMDLAVRDTEFGHLWLVDHKTAGKKWKAGKGEPRTNNQPAMYIDAWEKATGERPDGFAFDVMTYAGVFERRGITVTDHDIDHYLAKEAVLLPLLNSKVALPPNTSSFLCSAKWCDYWSICPFGGGGVSAHPVEKI